jgi:hypothetical protein
MLDDGDGPAVGIETRCARRRLPPGNPLTTRLESHVVVYGLA